MHVQVLRHPFVTAAALRIRLMGLPTAGVTHLTLGAVVCVPSGPLAVVVAVKVGLDAGWQL